MYQLSRKFVSAAMLIVVIALSIAFGRPTQRRVVSHNAAFLGDLQPGAYPVGFKTLRLDGLIEGSNKRLTAETSEQDKSRVLQVNLTYPARKSATGAPMTFELYLYADLSFRTPSGLTEASKQAESKVFKEFYEKPGDLNFGSIAEDRWAKLLLMKSLATRNAETAGGRFPFIVGQGNPFDSFTLDEYLASHGYIVARVLGPEPPSLTPAQFTEWEAHNLELAIAHLRGQPNVDGNKLGLIGFSLLGGFPALLVAMNNPAVDALVTLDSPLFVEKNAQWLKPAPSYAAAKLKSPFLYLASAALDAQGKSAEFTALSNSLRYRVVLNDAGVHHADLSSHGIVAAAVLKMRGNHEAAARAAHRWSAQYVRHFLSAYVKKDSSSLAFLRRKPEENNIPTGFLAIETLPPSR